MQLDDDQVEHWRAVVAKAPDSQQGWRGLAKALIESGRPDEILESVNTLEADRPDLAAIMLQSATRAAPENKALWVAYCKLAAAQGDKQQENLRWMMFYRWHPNDRDVQLGYIRILERQKRFANAGAIAMAALEAGGEDSELRELLADLSGKKVDWREAAEHLKVLIAANPGRADLASRLEVAEMHLRDANAQMLAVKPIETPITPVEPVRADEKEEIKELLLGFESLGSNCEFGLLQRRFGAEPLGLLRFAGTLPITALHLLKNRFSGIGEPEQMKIVSTPKEYRMRHLESGWGMHTRIKPTPEMTPERVMKDQCRHTTFLRKKLIKELEQQSKIFVYSRFVLKDTEISDIYHAVQSYGPNMLMCVRLGDADRPPGSIEWRTDRLMIASLDRAGREEGIGWNISVDYWAHFCRTAQARWTELQAASKPELADVES
jgi:hypothetical protein